MIRPSTILLLVLLSGCYISEELPPDQDVWLYDYPRHQGMMEADLKVLDARIAARGHGQINGLMIIKNDRLIFENYYNGYRRPDKQSVGRATNLVTTLTLGMLLEDGYLPNINVLIRDYLPDYADVFENDDLKSQITIKHLLNHQSGIPWDEYIVHPENINSNFQVMRRKSDWTRFILELQMEATPGLRTVLNSGSSMILSTLFQNLLGETSLESYIKEKLFDPIGITNYNWEYDPSGNLNLARGLSISTIDFTKLGYLTLLEGRWTDKRRIINREWILDSTELSILLNQQFGFGYGWWGFTEEFEFQALKGLDTYFVSGSLGQNMYVVPEHNLIIMIMGENYFSSSIYNPSLDIFIRCLATITSSSGTDI